MSNNDNLNNKDEEILDILSEAFKKEAEETELPEALSKENIVAMLKAMQAEEKAEEAEEKQEGTEAEEAAPEEEGGKKSAKKISIKKFTGFVAAAAAFAVIIGAGSAVLKDSASKTAAKNSGSVTSEISEVQEEDVTECETSVEQVTEEIVDGEGEVIGTELATDNSGNIVTTIVNVIDSIEGVLGSAAPESQGNNDPSAYEESSAAQQESAADTQASEEETPVLSFYEKETQLVGSRYSSDGYYYLDDSNTQKSYNDVYAEYSGSAGLYIDQVRVNFEYENKQWMIQLWKGQYGINRIGAEIGIYTCASDKYNAESNDYGSFTSAEKSDQLGMSLSMSYKADGESGSYKTMFTRPYGTGWHCTGFVEESLQKYSAPRTEIKTLNRITFKSTDMAGIFADRLQKLGFTKAESDSDLADDTYAVKGSDVYILWYSVYTGDINGSSD